MSQIDYTTNAGQLQLQESINSELRIRAGVRAKATAGCYTTLPASKSKQSKSLNIGTLTMSKVDGDQDDIAKGEITVGATYLAKEEYAQEILFPGSMLRYAQRDPVPKATERLMEADDYLMDKTLMDALVGPMYVGDTFQPVANAVDFVVEHDDLGITPEKVTEAVTMIKRFMPSSNVTVGIDADMLKQMTAFGEFTNNDLMLGGQRSTYAGKIFENKWFDCMFKMIPDFVEEDASDTGALPKLLPVMPLEKYIVGGTWDGISYIRHVPIWASNGVDFEEMMAPSTEVFPVWKQRSKPKGTLAARIDHELGFARNNPYCVSIMKVVIQNKYLSL